MVGQTRIFAHSLMLFGGENSLVSPPEVGVANALFVRFGNRTPEQLAGGFTPSAYDAGYDLPRPLTECQPYPASVMLTAYKRPQLIEFEYNRFGVVGVDQRISQRWCVQGFFLSHAVTVVLDTPNVRLIPRKLERS